MNCEPRGRLNLVAVCWAITIMIGAIGCGGAAPSGDGKTRKVQTSESAAAAPARKSARAKSNISDEKSSEPATPLETLVADPVQNAEPQPIFRPNDARQKHNDQELADLGIKKYESTRLILYTDIDPQIARTLPAVIDQAYQALVEYFGPLPPDRARTEFQMTGYLIKSEALFREAGLIPEDLPTFEHGRHRRNEFWMREQKYDYYRRHLLIHEATHCFMTITPDVDAPVWYMEGMAEYFGSHRLGTDGKATFRVMPTSPEEFGGMGRINLIRDDYAAARAMTISAIQELAPNDYLKNEPYAWSWGLCVFLDTHPRYQARFREMKGYLQRNAFPNQFYRVFRPDFRDMVSEWQLFVTNLQYGYDSERAAIDFLPGRRLSEEMPQRECRVEADRGWQSTEVLVEAGQTYDITATGQFELANQPRPWISEPQGISFRYFNGVPIGRLLGCIRTESGETDTDLQTMLVVWQIGRGGPFQAPVTGTLYLRVNDAWNSLADNRGGVHVEIARQPPK